jgi:hypothetical protein
MGRGEMMKKKETPKVGNFMGIKGAMLNEVTFEFSQDVDSCQSAEDICQSLKVQTPDAGGGAYIVIETTRWAIDGDDIDKFAATLKKIVGLPESDG